jgi:hypothetical protein
MNSLKVKVEVKKVLDPTGTFHWAVYQDGRCRDLCETEYEAQRTVDNIVDSWESKDE